ncbi:hypothetical protein [Cohnella hongkongensis]|uniref:Uncharacterized protein n=1 Tax=Cohnella hongkongensis TaxID=178337 RepID=A0ABV9FEC3_9BACL
MSTNLHAGIPEHLARFTPLPNEKGHNAVWDFVRAPDGRFYLSVCGENEKPLTALLYEYLPATGELRLILDVAKIWIVDSCQMPPSKIHTSIDFLPDGRLILATHNTAPAPGHRQWMFEQHYEHPWEGYPGSILMIVDPNTNQAEIKGIPVPRESIYGGMLGSDPRFYYFLGYMRGHFYRLDLETNEVKDYGKVSEFSSCRLAKDAKGRLYGSSYSGGFWRYDPGKDEIEDLKLRFLPPSGTKHRRQFIFSLHTPRDTLLLVGNMDGEMIELDPDTLEATRHGSILPEDVPSVNGYGIGGLAADDRFVLYYGLKTYDEYYPIRLVRWDLLGGGRPHNLGLITWGGRDSQYISEMIFDERGQLHMVDVCGEFSPFILTVDAGKLEPPGADAPRAALRPYVEPDYNGVGSAAFMHIRAKETRTLPLHQSMDWNDTAVGHLCVAGGRLYTVGGRRSVWVTESEFEEETPRRIENVYEAGGPVSVLPIGADKAAVLTTNGRVLLLDPIGGGAEEAFAERQGALTRLLAATSDGRLLGSDGDGNVYVGEDGRFRRLRGLRVEPRDGHLLPLDEDRLLLSGRADELLVYSLRGERAEPLDAKSASIRGRMFQAWLTGGAVLADGTVVAGTMDGMLFTLSPDLRRRTVYGRLYSSGQLRDFLRIGDEEVVGVYGGEREAGHVFHYSPRHGFADLGRPRMIKDNPELSALPSEFGSIHHISRLAWSSGDGSLYVGSAELYGCVIRYRGVSFP